MRGGHGENLEAAAKRPDEPAIKQNAIPGIQGELTALYRNS